MDYRQLGIDVLEDTARDLRGRAAILRRISAGTSDAAGACEALETASDQLKLAMERLEAGIEPDRSALPSFRQEGRWQDTSMPARYMKGLDPGVGEEWT